MNNWQLHPEDKPPHYTFFSPFEHKNRQEKKEKEINERKKTLEKRRRKVKSQEEVEELRMKKKGKEKYNNDSAGRRNRPDWSCKCGCRFLPRLMRPPLGFSAKDFLN
jgi:hypothetical protein